MSTKGFTGGAGTGKTTRLLLELESYLRTNPLGPGQRVLALTFMHGSRRRLAERLAKSSARRHCECMTLDRFAWEICRRWRSRLRAIGGELPSISVQQDYDATCEAAEKLLAYPDVVKWVAARFPVIVLDEFQDCAPVRLALAQSFHGRLLMLIAADDFQNLNRTDESPGVAWLRHLGANEELTVNRRTSDASLLAAAQALRAGIPLPASASTSFKLIAAPSAAVAASFISQTIAPDSGKDSVLLSAARPGTSPWVDDVIELVATKQYGSQKAGPVRIEWETTSNNVAEAMVTALGMANGNGEVSASGILALPHCPVAKQLKRWAEYQRCISGRTAFPASEIREQVDRAVHHVHSFRSMPQTGRRIMTIHQAKNREFSVVIVLWPFQVVSDQILARRWLYNAITRAKRRAIIIVHDPQKTRTNAPPFA